MHEFAVTLHICDSGAVGNEKPADACGRHKKTGRQQGNRDCIIYRRMSLLRRPATATQVE